MIIDLPLTRGKRDGAEQDLCLPRLWPINLRNGTANGFERAGLAIVAVHPIRPYVGYTRLGRKPFFQAVYLDIAVTGDYTSCHDTYSE